MSVVERCGCPFCGSHYVMSELFLRVSNFFCVDNGGLADWMYEISVRKFLVWALCASLVLNVFLIFRNGFSLFFFLFFGFVWFGIFFLFVLCWFFGVFVCA